MRICLVSREFAPFHGWGAGTYASLMAQAMCAQGHEVHVLLGDPLLADRGAALRTGVHFHSVDWLDRWVRLPAYGAEPQRYAYAVYRKLLELHAAHRFEFIEFPDFLGEAYFALRGRRALGQFEGAVLGLRLHMTVRQIRALNHDDWIDTERATVEHMEGWCLRHADMLTAPCPQMAEHVRTTLAATGDEPPPLRVIEYPFPPEQVRELGAQQAGAQARPSDTPEVVFSGRYERRKGVHMLVRAGLRLLEEGRSVTFRFLGEDTLTGPLGTSMQQWLEKQIDASGVAGARERFIFEGRAPREQLGARYARAACVCLPSLWENFPFACMEAMALGCAVVGSDAGGMAHMIEHARSGLLAKGGCEVSLAEQLRRMLDDDELRTRCAAGAPRRIAVLCDPAKTALRVEEWVQEVRARMHPAMHPATHHAAHAAATPTRVSGSSPTPPAPLVSVIIPVYNLHQYLWQTIASVRAQSLEDWEVVVVDDGSDAPETVSAMDELARTADGEKLRVIRAPHGGLGHARNVGLHAARGRFVLPLDSDDMIAPTYMEQCVRVLRSGRNVGFVTAFLRHFTDDPEHPVAGWVPFGGDLEWMGVMNAASNACAMMPRELVLEVGGYDAELPAYEDWDLFASILERGYRGEVIPEFHILYRLRHASMMHTLGSQRHQLLRARLLAKHPGLSPHPSRTVRFMLGDCVDIYALGKQPERPSEDGRVFTRAQQLLHENMRYRIADKVNDVLRRAGVQGAVKRIVSGGD